MGLSADDPRRPLYAAARWMPAVGGIYLSFGILYILFGYRDWIIAMAGVCLAAGGSMFLVCASRVRAHRAWAVWCGIGLGTLFGFAVALMLALMVANIGLRDLARLRSIMALAFVVVLFAFFVLHVMIVWNLSNGFDGLREPPIVRGQYVGFEPVQPLAPRPVIPIEADDAPPARR